MTSESATRTIHGHEAMDLSVVLAMVKKGIVLIPLVIMFSIFFIRKLLVYPDNENRGGVISIINNEDGQSVTDQNSHNSNINSSSQITTMNNISSATGGGKLFHEYFLNISMFEENN